MGQVEEVSRGPDGGSRSAVSLPPRSGISRSTSKPIRLAPASRARPVSGVRRGVGAAVAGESCHDHGAYRPLALALGVLTRRPLAGQPGVASGLRLGGAARRHSSPCSWRDAAGRWLAGRPSARWGTG